jgi:hypothetical protein
VRVDRIDTHCSTRILPRCVSNQHGIFYCVEKTIVAFSKTKLHPIQQRLSRSGVQKICQISSLKDEWSPSSQDFSICAYMLAHEDLGSYSTRIISVARANRLRSTFDWLSSSSAKLLKSVKFFKYHIYVVCTLNNNNKAKSEF